MDKFVRTGIVALAGTVALGTAGFAVASASASTDDTKTPVVKREDTSSSWVQQTNLDDDPDDDGFGDSPTDHSIDTRLSKNTVNTHQTINTKNTLNTKDSVNTKNSAPTKNTPTNNTPTNNTVKTVNSTPTNNSVNTR